MGNRESQSLSEADFLDSSTELSPASSLSFDSLKRDSAHSVSSLGKSLAAFGAPLAKLDSPLGASRGSPVSAAAATDLCSLLNHHHHSDEEDECRAADGAGAQRLCACRRSKSELARSRIHPIVQSGRQLSKDFYWVLPPRRKQRQCQRSNSESCCQAGAARLRGRLRTPMDLVKQVRQEVFGVTDDESYAALSLHHWDTESAAKYLKVEQLFRMGLPDRDCCRRLLESNDWRLELAVLQCCRHRKSRSVSD